MSSELQLDVRHLNRWRRHLANTYEVKAGMVFIAGKTVWSMPERFKVVCMPCKALYKCCALHYLITYHAYVVSRELWWVAALHQGAPGQMTCLKDAPPCLYCFASAVVWTENKNVTQQLKKGRQRFWGKKCIRDSGWPGWRIFWPRNDLAPLLRWCRHW